MSERVIPGNTMRSSNILSCGAVENPSSLCFMPCFRVSDSSSTKRSSKLHMEERVVRWYESRPITTFCHDQFKSANCAFPANLSISHANSPRAGYVVLVQYLDVLCQDVHLSEGSMCRGELRKLLHSNPIPNRGGYVTKFYLRTITGDAVCYRASKLAFRSA
jgi:hypothetical protein